MKHLKIAYSFDVQYYFVDSDREIVPVEQTDFTDVAVAVLSDQDYDYIDKIDATGFGVPIMVIMPSGEKLPSHYLDKVDMVLSEEMVNKSRALKRQNGWPVIMNRLYYLRFSGSLSNTSAKRITRSTARAIRMAPFSKSIPQAGICTISLVLIFFSQTFVMPTSRWGICSSMKGRLSIHRILRLRSFMRIRRTLFSMGRPHPTVL